MTSPIRRKFDEFDELMSGTQDNRSRTGVGLYHAMRGEPGEPKGTAAMIRDIAAGRHLDSYKEFRPTSGTLAKQVREDSTNYKRYYRELQERQTSQRAAEEEAKRLEERSWLEKQKDTIFGKEEKEKDKETTEELIARLEREREERYEAVREQQDVGKDWDKAKKSAAETKPTPAVVKKESKRETILGLDRVQDEALQRPSDAFVAKKPYRVTPTKHMPSSRVPLNPYERAEAIQREAERQGQSSVWGGFAVAGSLGKGIVDFVKNTGSTLELALTQDIVAFDRQGRLVTSEDAPFHERLNLLWDAMTKTQEFTAPDTKTMREYHGKLLGRSLVNSIMPLVNPVRGMMSRSPSGIESSLSPVSEAMASWIDIDNQNKLTQVVGGIAESMPSMLSYSLPGIGPALMFNEVYKSTTQAAYNEYAAAGVEPDDRLVAIRGLGTAAILTGGMKLLNSFKTPAAKIFKETGDWATWKGVDAVINKVAPKLTESVVRTISAQTRALIENATKAGVARSVAGIAAGLWTKLTTELDYPLFGLGDDALITPKRVMSDFGSGAIYSVIFTLPQMLKNVRDHSQRVTAASKKVPLNYFKEFFDEKGNLVDAAGMRAKRNALAKEFHPDLGGDPAIMGAINAEYTDHFNPMPNVTAAYKKYGKKNPADLTEQDKLAIQNALVADLSDPETAELVMSVATETVIAGGPQPQEVKNIITEVTDPKDGKAFNPKNVVKVRTSEAPKDNPLEEVAGKFKPADMTGISATISENTAEANIYLDMKPQKKDVEVLAERLEGKAITVNFYDSVEDLEPSASIDAASLSKEDIFNDIAKEMGISQPAEWPTREVAEPTTEPAKETPTRSIESDILSKGNTVESTLSSKENLKTEVVALPISAVTPSMTADLTDTEGYDKKLQPRDTDRSGTFDLVNDISQKPNILALYGTDTVQHGLPVIDERGMVVVGNHRTAGILKMRRDNREGYEKYKQHAIDNAKKFGLNPEQLQGDFIVVRKLPAGADAYDLADKANISQVTDMSPTELAVRDAEKMTPELLNMFVPSDSGRVNTKENREFLGRFAAEIIPDAQRDKYMDKSGNWNTDGIKRVSNALFQRAYGSTRLLDLIAESSDNNLRRLTTSLQNIAPRVIALQEGIKAGDTHDTGIEKLIAESAERWVEMKQAGEDIHLFVNQIEIDDTEDIRRSKNMLHLINENIGSAKRLTQLYNDLVDAVEAAGDPRQQGLFATESLTSDTVIEIGKRLSAERAEERRTKDAGSQIEIQPEARQASDAIDEEKQIERKQARPEDKTKTIRDKSIAQGVLITPAESRKMPQSEQRKYASEFGRGMIPPREAPKGVSLPSEEYNADLVELAHSLLSPARYERMGQMLGGYHQRSTEKGKDKVAVADISATMTLAHEVGHSLDYMIEGSNIEKHPSRTYKERFPDVGLTESELRTEINKVSKYMRPTKDWDEYRAKRTENMADLYSLYLLDPDKLKDVSPILYDMVEDKLYNSDYGNHIESMLSRREAERYPKSVLDMKGAIDLKNLEIEAKNIGDYSQQVFLRNRRERAADIAEKKFVPKAWRKKYSQKQRQDAIAIIENTKNMVTGKEPDRTPATMELVRDHRYRIEKARQDFEKVLSESGSDVRINYLEDYVAHFYKGKPGDRRAYAMHLNGQWAKTPRASKQRILDSYEEAATFGLEPLSYDIADTYEQYVELTANSVYNIALMQKLLRDTFKGTPLVSKEPLEKNWVRVDHPAVRRVLASKDKKSGAIIMWNKPGYLPPDAYKSLKPLLGARITNKTAVGFMKINAVMKNAALALSFFHYGNISESMIQSVGIPASIVRQAKKYGINENGLMWTLKAGRLLIDQPKIVREALLGGLSVDPFQDAMVGYARQALERGSDILKKVPVVSPVYDKLVERYMKFQGHLWNEFAGPLKIMAWHTNYIKALEAFEKKNGRSPTPKEQYAINVDTAKEINDAMGGQEKERYKISPAAWQVLQTLILAPDYTLSNIRNMFRVPVENALRVADRVSGKKEQPEEAYKGQWKGERKRWAERMIRLPLAVLLFGSIIQLAQGLQPMWENEPGKKTNIEITPLFELLGKTFGFDPGEQRYFFTVGKQVHEVLRLMQSPINVIGSKMSPLARQVVEQLTGVQPGSGWRLPFYEMEFYEGIPERIKHGAKSFVPYSLTGGNFAFTFPMSRGMSMSQAKKAYEDTIRLQYDPTIFGKLMPKGTAKKRKAELDAAVKANGWDPDERYRAAASAVRSDYYKKFFDQLNSGKTKEAELTAAIMVALNAKWSNVKGSKGGKETAETDPAMLEEARRIIAREAAKQNKKP